MAITGAPELLIVMGASATPDQVDEVVARLEEAGCGAVVTPGREATVIGAIGERELLAALPLEGYAGVEQVLPILKPYKLVSRELSPDPTVIEARGRRIGDGYFGFIAGPCSVETREQTLETARVVAQAGVTMLRGGAFKPRTSPYAFQGLGNEALEILAEALHARHRRDPGAEAGDAPAGDRRPLAPGRSSRPRAAARARRGRRRCRRDHRRDAPAARGGPERRAAADPHLRVPRVRGRDP